MKGKKAFGYVRVSVDEEGGNNASIAAQADAIHGYARQHGVEIVRIFEEPNVSGRKLTRKQFDRMIAAAVGEDKPVELVIVYALSRFARRLRTQVNAEHQLAEAGVRLVSLTESFGDDANGSMMRSIVAVMNEKYAHDASLFTRRDRRGNARAGYWNGGPVPFGYESRTVTIEGRKERRRLFVFEEDAAVVRLIHDLAEHGIAGTPMGTRSIAEHLNALGHTFRGRPFYHSNVDGILTREHYLGSYRDRTAGDDGAEPNEENAILIPCPQIVPVDQRARIVATRARAAPRVTPPRITNSPVLLTGLASCGHEGCGSGLAIRTGKGGRYSYYTCNAKLTAGAAACLSRPMRQEELDRIATDAVLDRVLAPDRLTELLGHVLERSDAADEKRRTDLDRVRREQQATEVKLRRLYEMVEDGLVSHRDAVFAERLANLNETLSRLASTQRSLASQLASGKRRVDGETLARFGQLVTAQMQQNPQFRRAYLRMFVSRVIVDDRQITIAGTKEALEAAIAADHKTRPPAVPRFDREWCRLQDSNLRPPHYECDALPAELKRRAGRDRNRAGRLTGRGGAGKRAEPGGSFTAP